ncbi:hypothetical protein KKA02_01330 [Patescibacteria group bacterium]|nr:hypothetical protein [Patescibacteria group bacterium]
MGLFSSKTEEEKLKKIFDKYGLDIENYDTVEVKKQNSKNLKQIAQDIIGNGWFKASMALSPLISADKRATVGYLSAIVNQNWILIRQNELIIRLLENKTKKK